MIRAEIRPAFIGDAVDNRHGYEDSLRLAATLEETLRLTFGSGPVRKVVVPTVVSIKVLKPGNPVIIAIRQLHYSESAFGPSTSQLDPERSLKDPNLKKSMSNKHFAGGVTYCPGRILAIREVLVFVVMVLHSFDIEVSNGGSKRRGGDHRQ